MTILHQIYKCDKCGNIIEVLHIGGGELVCCGEPMKLQEEKTADEGKASSAEATATEEKHLPVIEKMSANVCEGSDGVKVKVGNAPHPMEEDHYIEWIEIVMKSGSAKKFLKPGEEPEAVFDARVEIVEAREYCNIHGLWKS